MPPLPNVKHEKYAQGLASGMKQIEAYQDAGFSPSAGNASSLAKKPHIRERVLELSEEARLKVGVTTPIPRLSTQQDGTLTPESGKITEEWLVQQLMNNIQQAQLNGKFREANTAIEMLGNYFGGLFDKKNPVDQTQKNKGKGKGDPTEGAPSLIDMASKLAESLSKPDADEEEEDD
jgi:hypothetical protein